ncbi:MAG: hypothetical protein BWY93_01828 [Euryarchaeota archaeon ADurb.BinA087]|nr:MAG: hypothetical protein BWY93_01828 [Euryarchaeota archaeon ADurb.BinA087]
MTIQQFACHHAAEVFNLLDVPIDGLLKNFINNFKIPRKVRSFQTSREINKNIEIGYEYDRTFFTPRNLNQFLDILHANTGEVDTDCRGC